MRSSRNDSRMKASYANDRRCSISTYMGGLGAEVGGGQGVVAAGQLAEDLVEERQGAAFAQHVLALVGEVGGELAHHARGEGELVRPGHPLEQLLDRGGAVAHRARGLRIEQEE